MSKRDRHSRNSFSNETYLGFERDNNGPSPAGRMLADRLNNACIILSKRSFL